LTWNPTQGLQDCNCLRVFFEFKQTLLDRAKFYREQFGVVPKFKAGVNLGPVTVAEVGVLKRDIAYLSDVLNTAARLESMCHEHSAELLITETLQEALPEADDLRCEPIGELELRGKSERISVYRVEPQ
jgi:adenylate cyclase